MALRCSLSTVLPDDDLFAVGDEPLALAPKAVQRRVKLFDVLDAALEERLHLDANDPITLDYSVHLLHRVREASRTGLAVGAQLRKRLGVHIAAVSQLLQRP